MKNYCINVYKNFKTFSWNVYYKNCDKITSVKPTLQIISFYIMYCAKLLYKVYILKCKIALRKSLDLRDVTNMFCWTVDWIGIFHLKNKNLIVKGYQLLILSFGHLNLFEYKQFHIINFRISPHNDCKINVVS